MKFCKILFAFFLIFIGVRCIGQDNIAIQGTWKIAAMYDDDIYYDFVKDSIWIKRFQGGANGLSKEFIDSTERSTKMMLKGFLGDMQVEFRKDNTCTMSESVGAATEGRYSVNEKQKTLKILENGKDEQTQDIIKYKIANGRLIFLPGEDDEHTIEFKKEKN